MSKQKSRRCTHAYNWNTELYMMHCTDGPFPEVHKVLDKFNSYDMQIVRGQAHPIL